MFGSTLPCAARNLSVWAEASMSRRPRFVVWGRGVGSTSCASRLLHGLRGQEQSLRTPEFVWPRQYSVSALVSAKG